MSHKENLIDTVGLLGDHLLAEPYKKESAIAFLQGWCMIL